MDSKQSTNEWPEAYFTDNVIENEAKASKARARVRLIKSLRAIIREEKLQKAVAEMPASKEKETIGAG